MIEVMKKNYVLIISLLLSAVWYFLGMNGNGTLPCGEPYTDKCAQIVGDIWIATIIIIPVAIFSLLTYFLREEVFRAWFRFTYWWIPLSFIIVLFSSSRQPANIVGISDQAIFGVLTLGLYVLVSLSIVVLKYFTPRRSGHA
jgi:hypothetical protein